MSMVGGSHFFFDTKAAKYANKVVHEICAVQPEDEVLILTDTVSDTEIWKSIVNACAAVGAKWTLVVCPAFIDETRPWLLTEVARQTYLKADVVINCLYSVYPNPPQEWVEKRRKALESGHWFRGAILQCRSLRSLTGGGADADPCFKRGDRIPEFWKLGERIRPYVEEAEKGVLHCTSDLGTDLTCIVKDVRTINFIGNCLPDGEFMIFPVKGSAKGVILIDGPIARIRESTGFWGNTYPWEPIKLIVKNGRYVDVIGNSGAADKFRWLFKNIPNADNFGEFAFGTNRLCRQTGEFSEEKKRLGNAHIAYGRGSTPNVECKLHCDFVLRKPRVEIDGVPIIDKGKLLV